jgi:hypothetical protein
MHKNINFNLINDFVDESVNDTVNDMNNIDNDWSDFALSLEENHECPICLESFNLKSNNLVKSCCNHYYCKPCYNKINICSICRSDLKKNTKKSQQQSNSNAQPNVPNRFTQNEGAYFNYVQPITSSGNFNTYSFALRPENHQPSGFANFSRINSINPVMNPPIDPVINSLINPTINSVINPVINTNNLNTNPTNNNRLAIVQEPDFMDMANERMISELKRLSGDDQLFTRELFQRK